MSTLSICLYILMQYNEHLPRLHCIELRSNATIDRPNLSLLLSRHEVSAMEVFNVAPLKPLSPSFQLIWFLRRLIRSLLTFVKSLSTAAFTFGNLSEDSVCS